MIMEIIIIIIIIIIMIIIVTIIKTVMSIKTQAIWLKNCFLKLCFKVFKLLAFFNVCWILFQNKGPMQERAIWLVFVFQKSCLSFKNLFLKDCVCYIFAGLFSSLK